MSPAESVSLREHLECRISELDQKYAARLDERDRRHNERFEAEQRAAKLALEATKEALSAALVRVEGLERRVSRFENREEGMSLTSKFIVGLVGLLATLVGLWLAFNR